jgi:hypothetical protein
MQILSTIEMELSRAVFGTSDSGKMRTIKDSCSQDKRKFSGEQPPSYQNWVVMAKGGSPKMKDREESEPATQGRL